MGKPVEYKESEVLLSESNLKEAARMFAQQENEVTWALLKVCATNYEAISRPQRMRERREERARKRAAKAAAGKK